MPMRVDVSCRLPYMSQMRKQENRLPWEELKFETPHSPFLGAEAAPQGFQLLAEANWALDSSCPELSKRIELWRRFEMFSMHSLGGRGGDWEGYETSLRSQSLVRGSVSLGVEFKFGGLTLLPVLSLPRVDNAPVAMAPLP